MTLRSLALCAIALAPGCLLTDEPDDTTAQTTQAAGGGGNCDEFMCGTNSPEIAEFGFWDLQVPPAWGTYGSPNNVGLKMAFFRKNDGFYLPRVVAGRLIANPVAVTPPYNVPLTGQGLIGGAFWLVNGTRLFQLRIADVGRIESWAQRTDNALVMLETYKLDWTEFLGAWGDFRSVCKHPPSRSNPDALGMVGAASFHSLLFEGDRIHAAQRVDLGVDTTWFNIGCAGSALAKMALTGHTHASRVSGAFITSLNERTAMLKLLSADYCELGTPFTVGGQPLNWRDDRGTMELLAPPQPVALEARWNEHGAICLNKPRVEINRRNGRIKISGQAKFKGECHTGEFGDPRNRF